MKLVTPDMIPKIDKYAVEKLKIKAEELMKRSALAVKEAVLNRRPDVEKIVILAGKGNNGGDGYALAAALENKSVTVCDVFSAGQRTDEGRFWLNEAKSSSALFINGICPELISAVGEADVIVDAIFGTGFIGEPPAALAPLVKAVNSSTAYKAAVDIPLGANALDGSVHSLNMPSDLTVTLSYPKAGLLSYPAKAIVGELVHSDIGLPKELLEEKFEFSYYSVDEREAKLLLPVRKNDSNKGSFGKNTLVVGSDAYRGAAHLAVEAALRGGAGIVRLVATEELCREIRLKFPEVIYFPSEICEKERILDFCRDSASVLVGCGSGVSEELCALAATFVESLDANLIFDADALNSIARFSSPEIFKKSKRPVVITPHPLELSRLSGKTVSEIESARLPFAKSFAAEYGCILLLKGASTVVTDGITTYINDIATAALSKGGSGDVLAGVIASLLAFSPSPIKATALAAFVHATAGKVLESELSSFGVTPSDLPREMAKILAEIEKST